MAFIEELGIGNKVKKFKDKYGAPGVGTEKAIAEFGTPRPPSSTKQPAPRPSSLASRIKFKDPLSGGDPKQVEGQLRERGTMIMRQLHPQIQAGSLSMAEATAIARKQAIQDISTDFGFAEKGFDVAPRPPTPEQAQFAAAQRGAARIQGMMDRGEGMPGQLRQSAASKAFMKDPKFTPQLTQEERQRRIDAETARDDKEAARISAEKAAEDKKAEAAAIRKEEQEGKLAVERTKGEQERETESQKAEAEINKINREAEIASGVTERDYELKSAAEQEKQDNKLEEMQEQAKIDGDLEKEKQIMATRIANLTKTKTKKEVDDEGNVISEETTTTVDKVPGDLNGDLVADDKDRMLRDQQVKSINKMLLIGVDPRTRKPLSDAQVKELERRMSTLNKLKFD